jgi:hypothetical protein
MWYKSAETSALAISRGCGMGLVRQWGSRAGTYRLFTRCRPLRKLEQLYEVGLVKGRRGALAAKSYRITGYAGYAGLGSYFGKVN